MNYLPDHGYDKTDAPAAPPQLVEGAAKAILDAWNASYTLNPAVMTQAGESFKRRFYADIVIDYLRSLPVEQRMEAVGMREADLGRFDAEGPYWEEKP